ncbi:BamA/TamA family outer membrane protein [Gemmatimonadota bacterium]
MPSAVGFRTLVLSLVSLALLSTPLGSQECPEGEVTSLFIDNRSIFRTSDMEPGTRFLWAYRLANRLHRRTKKDFIEKELLFRVGECLDSLRLAESARILRNYKFIGYSDIYPVPMPDGSHHVVVDTQDEWTTRVDLGIRFDGGLKIDGAEFTEENLLGRGLLVRVFFQEDDEQRDLGAEFQTPRLMGTRWDARMSAGKTRSGDFFEEALAYPFVGEIGRLGARQTYTRRETLFAYAVDGRSPFSHLLVPFLDKRADLAAGVRVGRPGNLTLFGLGVSRESLRFRRFPEDLEYVRSRNYSNTVPADSAGVAEVEGHVLDRNATRINFFLGQRNLRFVRRRGLDALQGIQDVAVGAEVTLALGRALESLQKSGEVYPDDLHTQVSIFVGAAWESWVLNGRLATEARQVFAGEGRIGGWRDVFTEADGYLYWQPGSTNHHTLFFRASATGGWSVDMPFQLTLGGSDALRGYRENAFPGGRRVLFSLEDRSYLPWPAPDLFDFGFTVFADVGRMEGGGVPFGIDSGWHSSAGAGIRFGLPPGTTNTARIDLALPISSKTQLGDLILRVHLHELLGILPGLRDTQLLRSLRTGVKGDLISLPW